MLKDMADEADALDVIDTRASPHVRITNAKLDEDANSPSGVIIRGRIARDTIRFIRRDPSYQRKQGARPDLFEAIRSGVVMPPVDLAVRGEDFQTLGDDEYVIRDKVYAVDGFGRIQEALAILDNDPNADVRLDAVVHFGSTAVWERHRFTEMNRRVVKVSANLHYKNHRDSSTAVTTLYGLSFNQPDFALYKRVAWGQKMLRGEIVSIATLVGIVRVLHSHLPQAQRGSRIGRDDVRETMRRLQHVADTITLPVFRANVSTFYQLIDDCWDIQSIEHVKSAPHMKRGFQMTLAHLVDRHADFWNDGGTGLRISAGLRRKLAAFPVNDPHIAALAAGNNAAQNILYEYLVKHMNSGKRVHHLRPWYDRSEATS